jgi:tRNA threonylcarbamoyladenosine biosynthesis protein TsaE
MMEHKLVYQLEDLPMVAETLHQMLGRCAVITLTGSLGAGKTTLTQALLKACGIEEVIQSPTFNYVSIYTNASGWRFYHFDLYRLKSLEEFMNAGFHEYLYEPMSYAIIEWPEIIMPLLKTRVCHAAIEYVSEDSRLLMYTCIE